MPKAVVNTESEYVDHPDAPQRFSIGVAEDSREGGIDVLEDARRGRPVPSQRHPLEQLLITLAEAPRALLGTLARRDVGDDHQPGVSSGEVDRLGPLGLTRVISLIASGNTASIRVAEKIGETFEREIPDGFFRRPVGLYSLNVPAR